MQVSTWWPLDFSFVYSGSVPHCAFPILSIPILGDIIYISVFVNYSNVLESMHILCNQLLPDSGQQAPPSVIKIIMALTTPPPSKKREKKCLCNLWTEIMTFHISNLTKDYKKILELGPLRGQGWVMIRRQHKLNNS